MPKQSTDYDASSLTALEGLEAVRKRPGMYIGSTGSAGLIHLVWEIVDNSVDEAIAGHCSNITITLHSDGSVEVVDDGRGIPVDVNKKSKLTGVELVMTKLHAGGKFGGSGYKTAGGLHGVGASVVNALSQRVDVTVRRDGGVHAINFQRGTAGEFATENDPTAAFSAKKGLRRLKKMTKKDITGTTVRFWPDPSIFLTDAVIDPEKVRARARQTAFLVPGLTLTVNDHLSDEPTSDTFNYTGGVEDMVDYLATDAPVSPIVHITGSGAFTETVPVLDDNGNMTPTDIERTVDVNIAFRWGNGYDKHIASFVNVVSTPNNGTHVKGFDRALVKTIRSAYDGTRLMKANEDPVILDDILEGLTAVVSVGVPEPQFIGQTKDELGTTGVTKVVQTIVAEELRRWLGKNKTAARTVLEKIANASRTRIAARTQKEAARRKTALEGASMPAKLVDCRATGVDRSELFLVEGDSALGSARQARNSEYQALLPLRGKILNVQKASMGDMLKNAECAAIIQVLGAGSGRNFDIDQMRYGRLILFADADVDGSHIRTLLITLVYKYMRPIIEEGRLYTAMPPLHKIETTGRNKQTTYTYTQLEMEQTVAKLEKTGKSVKTPVQRYKGLGEMNAGELWETTLDPSTRTLRKISLDDAEAAEASLELLMGKNVEQRRNWLIANSARVNLDELS